MPDLSRSLRDLIEQSARPFDVDAIVRDRRRRRRVRRIGVVGAVVLVAAVATGSVLARPANEPKVVSVGGSGGTGNAAAEAAATRAALAQLTIVSPGGGPSYGSETFASAPPMHLTDPISGATRAIPFPVPGVRGWTVPFLTLGSHVVMMVDQDAPAFPGVASGGPLHLAFVLSSTLGEWRSIGGPVTSVFAAKAPDAVWTVDDGYVTEASWAAVPFGGPYRLTRGRVPFAEVDGGLLTARPGGSPGASEVYEVWDPKTGRAVRQLPIAGAPFAVSGEYAAWIPLTCAFIDQCPLHLTDLRSGTDRSEAPPRGTYWSGEGAFAPDGAQLAVAAVALPSRRDKQYIGAVVPAGTHTARVAVIDATSGDVTTRALEVWKGGLNPKWSTDGTVVLVTLDRTHVAYFNVAYPRSAVHEVAVPDADSYLVVAAPAAPSPGVAQQRWSYNGLVAADRLHSPELCIYATAEDLSPYSDNCSGPQVVGWPAATKASGTFRLVGTYNGEVFTLTQRPNPPVTTTVPTTPPASAPSSTQTPTLIGSPSGCPTPAGGWRVTDPARLTFGTYTAVTAAAQGEPGYVGTWVGPYTAYPGVVDAKLPVLNFAFTGNVDAHRRALSAIYGGPICVVQRGTHTEAELQAIVHQLFGAFGRRLGLQMLSGGPDELDGAVTAEAIAVTPAQRAAVDRRFGPGIVHLNSRLTPLP